jgi:hypothetical protein
VARVEDVFTPGGEPSVTYVGRERLGLERKVRSALRRRHSFVVVSGPTKCGKSVLCKRLLRDQPAVTVQGGLVTSIEEFWNLIAHQLNLVRSATATQTSGLTDTRLREVSASLWGWLTGRRSSTAAVAQQRALTSNYTNVLSLDAIGALRRDDATLLIEDFHFITTDTQRAIIRALKAAVFDGLRVIILAVPHRAFDAADVEDEVEGRMEHVAIPNWSLDDLLEIPDKGFAALGLDVTRGVQRRICEDGFGNPLLVQEICYELSEARLANSGRSVLTEAAELTSVYNDVASRKGLDRFELLAYAPLPEGASPIRLRDKTLVDLNNAVLGAIARIGPKPTTSLDDLLGSLETLTEGAAIERDQVVSVLSLMTKAIAKGNSAPFEWELSRATLNITDPFLMFYIRWVLRDQRAITLQPSALEIATMVQPTTDLQAHGDESR